MVGLPSTHFASVISLPSSSVNVSSSGTFSPSRWSNPTLALGRSCSAALPGASPSRPCPRAPPASRSAAAQARSGHPRRRLLLKFVIGPLPNVANLLLLRFLLFWLFLLRLLLLRFLPLGC